MAALAPVADRLDVTVEKSTATPGTLFNSSAGH